MHCFILNRASYTALDYAWKATLLYTTQGELDFYTGKLHYFILNWHIYTVLCFIFLFYMGRATLIHTTYGEVHCLTLHRNSFTIL
jgi:hypothetical protein